MYNKNIKNVIQIEHTVKNVFSRLMLNSHRKWTNEFIVELSNGNRGNGTSPQGETISIYENYKVNDETTVNFLNRMISDKIINKNLNQLQFDNILKEMRTSIGQENTFALSLAFFDAVCKSSPFFPSHLIRYLYDISNNESDEMPAILLNVLNGGYHAYTNPILSDFHEYLLVPKFSDIQQQILSFDEVNILVKEKLHKMPMTQVGKNWVFHQNIKDNRVWLDLLIGVLEELGLYDNFSLMIDASAGDLLFGGRYRLALTDNRYFGTDEFCEYWSDLLANYPIYILEDPLSEIHKKAWTALKMAHPNNLVAGDNLCATNPLRVSEAAQVHMISAVLIKPNQAGTVSDTVHAIKTALDCKLTSIPSHRSVETESTFLSDLVHAFGCRYVKLGLLTDFDTIIKLNKLVRYYNSNQMI